MDFQKLMNAQLTFEELGTELEGLYGQVSSHLDNLWGIVKTFIDGVLPPAIFAIVLAVLSVVQLFWGKKLLGFQKFLAAFTVGYAVGAAFVTPMLAGVLAIDPMIVGLAVGVLGALLRKPIYFLAYVLCAGYPAYLFAMLSIAPGAMPVGLAVGVAAIVLALLLRKLIETLGLSLLGAYCLYLSVDAIMAGGLVAMLGELEPTISLVIVAVVGLIGFIAQWKNRRRY